ncbi:Y+L amino acid transporter 2-like [Diabrotica virgifera virgifera]|uniref:Large neutral amino acids transporter small subunit 2 n=1 Tax=Diabrotica virgifera virgifera TaxID=50390 RepID=A0ABM5KJP4_DIAVI|nr:Y+L amino acid transporter 2 [Diabrotica virgifera virgifera]XP_050510426.1 Y+L amino acid transporter 2-like [Diabrotica virgifera virgifera]
MEKDLNMTSTEENPDDDSSGIKMKKELSLMDGVAIIVGVIIGSGIFVSPKGVLKVSGSIGLAIIVWILSGALSMIGALCYTELGTMIPKSGGDYAYIKEAFGSLPSFLYLWVALFVLVPVGNAITAITFAQYIVQPLWGTCPAPYEAVRLIAAATICILTAINCYNVKWVTRVQGIFTATKMFALGIIVIAGIYYACTGHVEHFQRPMQGSNWDPGHIALAFYSGLFSYSGYNYLNYVTEELKDPYKNLPKAICISMPVVTIVYVVTNIAYFIVLSKDDVLASEAVAVTFGDKILGMFSFLMPLFVACSTFGSLNGAIFASSRLFYVGARDGHLPQAICLISVKRLTPVPSLVFLAIITLALVMVEDVYALINYGSFVEALFITVSIVGLLYMRRTHPKAPRPIKVNLILPITFFIICGFLVTFPCYVTPLEVGVGVAFILCGIPVYFVTIYWQNKPLWLQNFFNDFNNGCAKLFMCVPAESEKDF